MWEVVTYFVKCLIDNVGAIWLVEPQKAAVTGNPHLRWRQTQPLVRRRLSGPGPALDRFLSVLPRNDGRVAPQTTQSRPR